MTAIDELRRLAEPFGYERIGCAWIDDPDDMGVVIDFIWGGPPSPLAPPDPLREPDGSCDHLYPDNDAVGWKMFPWIADLVHAGHGPGWFEGIADLTTGTFAVTGTTFDKES